MGLVCFIHISVVMCVLLYELFVFFYIYFIRETRQRRQCLLVGKFFSFHIFSFFASCFFLIRSNTFPSCYRAFSPLPALALYPCLISVFEASQVFPPLLRASLTCHCVLSRHPRSVFSPEHCQHMAERLEPE